MFHYKRFIQYINTIEYKQYIYICTLNTYFTRIYTFSCRAEDIRRLFFVQVASENSRWFRHGDTHPRNGRRIGICVEERELHLALSFLHPLTPSLFTDCSGPGESIRQIKKGNARNIDTSTAQSLRPFYTVRAIKHGRTCKPHTSCTRKYICTSGSQTTGGQWDCYGWFARSMICFHSYIIKFDSCS